MVQVLIDWFISQGAGYWEKHSLSSWDPYNESKCNIFNKKNSAIKWKQHSLVILGILTTMKRPYVRIFGEIICRKYIEMFRNTDWEQLFASADDLYSTFIESPNILYNECFPLKHLSRKRQRDKPWITKGLKFSINTRNKLYRKALAKSSEYIYTRYTHYKKIYRYV